MTKRIAFVGDIHGESDKLRVLIQSLEEVDVDRIVFLGDYVNKGPDGRGVLDTLIQLSDSRDVVCLRGNHEDALLGAVSTGDVRPLLRMAGAPTVLSYTGWPVGPDVGRELQAAMPNEHIDFLKGLANEYVSEELLACHRPLASDDLYVVSAHINVGRTPRITERSAEIDTGCGNPGGFLSAFLWPSKDWLQVD